MSDNRIDRIRKDFDRLTTSLVVIAIFFLSYGLYHYLILGTTTVTHAYALIPSLSNGSTIIFFGTIFFGLALYRIIRRKRLIDQIYQLKRSDRK
jgi:cytochrome c biogenesis protein CcdA